MRAHKISQQPGQMRGCKVFRHPQPHCARHFRRGRAGQKLAVHRQQFARRINQPLSRGGKLHRAGAPIEQLDPQLLFQPLKLKRDRGLSALEAFGGGGEAGAFRHGDKGAQADGVYIGTHN